MSRLTTRNSRTEEGTIELMTGDSSDSRGCLCCRDISDANGRHVFGLGHRMDGSRDTYGGIRHADDVVRRLIRDIMHEDGIEATDGRRIRVTVEVLP